MKNKLPLEIPHDYDGKSSTLKLSKLSFGKQKILLSNEELINLEKVYKHYVEKFGVEIGFINYLLNTH